MRVHHRRLPAALLAPLLVAASSSLKLDRQTETSGTLVPKARSCTILSLDVPKTAEQIARENASDANMPNMLITDVKLVPWLGGFDWLLDILSIRYCRISGTWGFSAPEGTVRSASPGSSPGS